MWGHGKRRRMVRGPLEPDGPPGVASILCQRFLCVLCRCVMLVVPRGMLALRQYGAGAIALALAAFGLEGQGHDAVRSRVSGVGHIGFAAYGRWVTLRRWVAAIISGRLFGRLGLADVRVGGTWRQRAARAAQAFLGHAPVGLRGASILVRAFHGGVQMA